MTKTSQEMFTYVARCPNCTDHGEKHMARHEWIVGQPETHRSDCEYCQRRDAITDGSVQLATGGATRFSLAGLRRAAGHF